MLFQITDRKLEAFWLKDFVPVLMSMDSYEISCSHSGVTGDSTAREMTLCSVCSSIFIFCTSRTWTSMYYV